MVAVTVAAALSTSGVRHAHPGGEKSHSHAAAMLRGHGDGHGHEYEYEHEYEHEYGDGDGHGTTHAHLNGRLQGRGSRGGGAVAPEADAAHPQWAAAVPHVHVSFFGVLLTLPDLSADRPLPSPAPHADPHARCHGGIAQLSQLYAPWPTDQLFRLSLHYQGLLPRRAAASDDERRSVLSAASAVLRRGTDRSAPPVPPPELA